MPKYLAAALLLACVAAALGDSIDVELRMPAGVPVSGEDAYVCTTVQLPDRPYKLTGVEPLARQETVHHMLLFGELGVVQQEGGHRAAPQHSKLCCCTTAPSPTHLTPLYSAAAPQAVIRRMQSRSRESQRRRGTAKLPLPAVATQRPSCTAGGAMLRA
jgi:hypothetical protein